jgi:hypothetical protein
MSAVFAIEHLGPFIVVDPSARENQNKLEPNFAWFWPKLPDLWPNTITNDKDTLRHDNE